jgi:hypothetical protein
LDFRWLLAFASGSFGFWLVACGFWLHFSMEGIFFWDLFLFLVFLLKSGADWGSFPCYLLHFGAKISHLHAHLAFGFCLCLHLALGFWFLVLVGFLALVSLGFWLLAFGRTSVECMCSIF